MRFPLEVEGVFRVSRKGEGRLYEVRSLPFGFELCYPIQHKLKSHLTAAVEVALRHPLLQKTHFTKCKQPLARGPYSINSMLQGVAYPLCLRGYCALDCNWFWNFRYLHPTAVLWHVGCGCVK